MLISVAYYIEFSVFFCIWLCILIATRLLQQVDNAWMLKQKSWVLAKSSITKASILKLLAVLASFPDWIINFDNYTRAQSILDAIAIGYLVWALVKTIVSTVETYYWNTLDSTAIESFSAMRTAFFSFKVQITIQFTAFAILIIGCNSCVAILSLPYLRIVEFIVSLLVVVTLKQVSQQVNAFRCLFSAKRKGRCIFFVSLYLIDYAQI